MKVTLTNITIILIIVFVCQSRRLKRRNNVTREQIVSALGKIDCIGAENTDLAGGFSEIYKTKLNNKEYIAKVLTTETNAKEKNAETEIEMLKNVKDLKFCLPLCKSTQIKEHNQLKAQILVLPKAEEDLLQTCERNAKEYSKSTTNEFDSKFKQIVQLALAVKEFHKAEFIHRDIKPANFLVMPDERIVLTDFGTVIKANKEKAEKQQEKKETKPTGMTLNLSAANYTPQDNVGTPLYMPLEAVMQIPDFDGKRDMYSLGITIAELIIPDFYKCMNGKKCSYPKFTDQIYMNSLKAYDYIQNFKDGLNLGRGFKEVTELQRKVEDLVFSELLVERTKRLDSTEFLAKLEKLSDNQYFKVLADYNHKVNYC